MLNFRVFGGGCNPKIRTVPAFRFFASPRGMTYSDDFQKNQGTRTWDDSAIFPTPIAVIGFLERRGVLGVCRLIVVWQPLGSLLNH